MADFMPSSSDGATATSETDRHQSAVRFDNFSWPLQSNPSNMSHQLQWLPQSESFVQEIVAEPHGQQDDDATTVFQEHLDLEIEEQLDLLLGNRAEPEEALPAYNAPHEIQQIDRSFNRPELLSLESAPVNDLSFLEWYPKGDASITFPGDSGNLESITGLNTWIIEERSPLLAQAFEPSLSGSQLYLEALNSATAKPLLRFLYTGTYALTGAHGNFYEDVPTSVLLHCQLYHLGDIYDMLDLRSQAYVNVLRQCEFGCSSPDKPIDLCEAIQFSYQHLRHHSALIETIISYCVSCLERHRLAEDVEFKQLAYDLRPFHQDLCKETMKRGFADDTAAAIIQLPFKPYSPETYASRDDVFALRFEDVVHHFHSTDKYDESPKKRKRTDPLSPPSQGPGVSAISLALRGKQPIVKEEDGESQDEDTHEQSTNRKRRASSAVEPCKIKSDAESDSDYELIPGPAPVEALDTDSDSDASTLVMVVRPASPSANEHTRLPIRQRAPDDLGASRTADNAENVDSGSDSEWTEV